MRALVLYYKDEGKGGRNELAVKNTRLLLQRTEVQSPEFETACNFSYKGPYAFFLLPQALSTHQRMDLSELEASLVYIGDSRPD